MVLYSGKIHVARVGMLFIVKIKTIKISNTELFESEDGPVSKDCGTNFGVHLSFVCSAAQWTIDVPYKEHIEEIVILCCRLHHFLLRQW